MSICHEKKLIFIHIPKNAGTSVYSYFNSPIESILPDQTWEKYSSFFSEYWNQYTKFSIIRNPYCRFKSLYKYLRIRSNINTFAKFVLDNHKRMIITRPQSDYICSENKIIVDKIVRYENLDFDLKKIGIDNFPLKNKSKSMPEEKLEMNGDTLDIIHSLYKNDFEIFKYEYIS